MDKSRWLTVRDLMETYFRVGERQAEFVKKLSDGHRRQPPLPRSSLSLAKLARRLHHQREGIGLYC